MKVLKDFQITFQDYPDDNSIALIIYFLGCDHNCVGCHNPVLQNYYNEYGVEYISIDDFYNDIVTQNIRNNTNNKIVFSGGDPLYKENLSFVKDFLNKYGDKLDICIYTGRTIEEVKSEGISGFTFIKCGKYTKDLHQRSIKTDDSFILASQNQNFYNSKYEELSSKGTLNFNKEV